MKLKHKKSILILVLFAAISLSVVANFFPIFKFDSRPYYEDLGYENIDAYQTYSYYLLCSKYDIYNYYLSDLEGSSVHTSRIYIAGVQIYDTFGDSKIHPLENYSYIQETKNRLETANATNLVLFTFLGILIVILIYHVSFKIVKNTDNINKNLLSVSGILLLLLLFFYQQAIMRNINIINPGYVKYLKIDLSYYYLLISSILFFIGYVLKYFIDKEEKVKEKEEIIFEKID